MPEVLEKFLLAFIPLFVAIDAVGLVAIFMGFAPNASREHRQHQGRLAVLTGLCVAVGFIFLGKIIFAALGISVADFQVAGGLILLGLAVRELLGFDESPRSGEADFGIVPLGMPLIAGPALLTALLLLMDTVGLVYTLISLVVNLAIVLVSFHYARRIEGLLGKQGLNGISKIVALLLAAIAVSLIRRGWQAA